MYSLDELMGSMQAHEQRINRSQEKGIEQFFQAKMEISSDKAEHRTNKTTGRGRYEGHGHGRGRGRGRGRSYGNQNNFIKQGSNHFSDVQCHSCKKYGHIKKFCPENSKHEANFFEEKKEENNLFLTCLNGEVMLKSSF